MHAAISILPQPIAEEIIPHLLFKLGIYRKWYGAHRFEEKYESGHTVWETKHWE
jgi:hypothetical protein